MQRPHFDDCIYRLDNKTFPKWIEGNSTISPLWKIGEEVLHLIVEKRNESRFWWESYLLLSLSPKWLSDKKRKKSSFKIHFWRNHLFHVLLLLLKYSFFRRKFTNLPAHQPSWDKIRHRIMASDCWKHISSAIFLKDSIHARRLQHFSLNGAVMQSLTVEKVLGTATNIEIDVKTFNFPHAS